MTTPPVALTRRNASLADLTQLLRAQHDAKLDMVLPAAAIAARDGLLHVRGAGQPELSMSGVTATDAAFNATAVCDETLADKLGIPTQYLRRCRTHHTGLYDANLTGWLHTDPDRRLLLRALRGDTGADSAGGSGGVGVARAVLSDRYRITDHLDVLMAVLAGIRATGAPVDISSCDLTERRMHVKVRSDAIAAHAPALLRNYVSPFTGHRGADNPVVFAGFVIRNSETGHGSCSITPRLVVQVCDNGLTFTADALREVHLGARLDTGVIRWSNATHDALLRLVTQQARDAVTTFLDPAYLQRKITDLETRAGVRVRDVDATLTHVAKNLRFTTEQQATILAHFIDGADRTSGGILHAITSTAQTLDDADDAHHLEHIAIRAMTLAATHQR